MNEDLSVIKTTNIDLAATIFCMGHDVNISPVEIKGRKEFIIIETPEILDIIENYWRGDISVEPREFAKNRKDLLVRLKEGM